MSRLHRQRLPLAVMFVVASVGILLTAQQRPYRASALETEQLLHRTEVNAERFHRGLDLSGQPVWDRGLGNLGDGTGIAMLVADFVRASHDLRDRFDRGQSVKREVEALLHRGAAIDAFMESHLLPLRTEQDWLSVRADLDALARMYIIPWQWSHVRDARQQAAPRGEPAAETAGEMAGEMAGAS